MRSAPRIWRCRPLPRRSGRHCRRSTAKKRHSRSNHDVRIQPTPSDHRAAGGRPPRQAGGSQAARGRPHAHPHDEAAARRAEEHHRPLDGRRADRHRGGRALADDRRHDATRRGRDLGGGEGGHSGACPPCEPHRRSRRAPSRHHRRLDCQQRSERRLSRGLPGARRHHHHQQAPHPGGRVLQGPVRNRARARGDHHQGAVSQGQQGGLHQVSQSGLALCPGGRVRVEAQLRDPRGGDGRRLERRLPRHGLRGGAQEALRRQIAGGADRARRRDGERHPRQRRVSRPPDRRAGPPGGRRRGVRAVGRRLGRVLHETQHHAAGGMLGLAIAREDGRERPYGARPNLQAGYGAVPAVAGRNRRVANGEYSLPLLAIRPWAAINSGHDQDAAAARLDRWHPRSPVQGRLSRRPVACDRAFSGPQDCLLYTSRCV